MPKAKPKTKAGKQKKAVKPQSKSKTLVSNAMHEVFTNEPSTVTRANVSGEKKRKMKVAVALSKARAKGAKIPKAK